MGCRLPDAILHGKRSLRPRSRAVQRVSATGFRVRLFSSLRLVVAPPACEPGQDTSVMFSARLDRLAPGRPPLLTVRLPEATGLASCLSGCLFLSQVSGAIFSIADARKVFTNPAVIPCPSRCVRPVCPAFRRLSFGRPSFDDRPSGPPVLIHSGNHYPLGNCDSPGPETSPDYLTRFGTVSHRALPPSSLFAFTDGARTPPEELVNHASSAGFISPRLHRGRANQPVAAFPRSPGRILEPLAGKLSSTGTAVQFFQ
jgi:hypothetical protein